MENVESRIKRIITEHLGVNEERVTPEADLVDGLGADSLDMVELVMALEEEFDCHIPDEQAENLKTVQDVVNLINEKVRD